jgi:hypothetical protein
MEVERARTAGGERLLLLRPCRETETREFDATTRASQEQTSLLTTKCAQAVGREGGRRIGVVVGSERKRE